MSNNPIFITGVYRSGTTLLSRALNNHPNIAVTYDSIHFMRFIYEKDRALDNNKIREIINEIEERVKHRSNANLDFPKILETLNASTSLSYGELYTGIMEDFLIKGEKKIWGEKTQLAWSKIPDFLTMFPDGKALLLIRDPRDIVSSFKRFTNEEGLKYLDGAFTSLSSMQYGKQFEKSLNADNFRLVRYEDLVSNYKNELKKLCEWIGVSWHEAITDTTKYKDNYGKLWCSNSSYGEFKKNVDTDSIGKYREYLSNVEIYFIEMILRAVLDNYNYTYSASHLSEQEWMELYKILEDPFINSRYVNWLKNNQGVEEYPSAPPRV